MKDYRSIITNSENVPRRQKHVVVFSLQKSLVNFHVGAIAQGPKHHQDGDQELLLANGEPQRSGAVVQVMQGYLER